MLKDTFWHWLWQTILPIHALPFAWIKCAEEIHWIDRDWYGKRHVCPWRHHRKKYMFSKKLHYVNWIKNTIKFYHALFYENWQFFIAAITLALWGLGDLLNIIDNIIWIILRQELNMVKQLQHVWSLAWERCKWWRVE